MGMPHLKIKISVQRLRKSQQTMTSVWVILLCFRWSVWLLQMHSYLQISL